MSSESGNAQPESSTSIGDLSAVDLRDQLASGDLTAVDVLEHYLSVIDEKNPELGAFMYLDVQKARAAAQTLDEQRQNSDSPVGALHGLPLAFKDLVNIEGMPTTFGSKVFEHASPVTEDDTVAATTREAGAVLVGKTTVPEFGLPSYSENLISDPARNPLNPSRTAGGSSGGAAAAVAAGMLPVAPGTDGGGSIRIPAAATGLVGLKPGRGTVPADDQRDVITNLAVTGPIARSARDAALLMDALVDPHVTRRGPYLKAADDGAAQGLGSLSIGYTTSSPFHPDLEITLSRHAVDALTRTVMVLARDGHEVTERTISYEPGYHETFQTVWTSGMARAELPEGADEQLDVLASYFLKSTRERSQEEIDQARERLTAWAAHTRSTFGESDLVLTPVLAYAPPEIGSFAAMEPQENYEAQCRFTPYTSMVNVMGLPAVSVPVLTDDNGFSWSIQAVGRPGTEAQLLAFAARLEVLLADEAQD